MKQQRLLYKVLHAQSNPPLGRSGKQLTESERVRETRPLHEAATAVVSTVGSKVCGIGRAGGVVGRGVDTNGDPGEQTVGDVVGVQVDKVGEGVVGRVVCCSGRPHVAVVCGDVDVVGVVRGRRLNCRAQGLVEEELADVGDVASGVCEIVLVGVRWFRHARSTYSCRW